MESKWGVFDANYLLNTSYVELITEHGAVQLESSSIQLKYTLPRGRIELRRVNS